MSSVGPTQGASGIGLQGISLMYGFTSDQVAAAGLEMGLRHSLSNEQYNYFMYGIIPQSTEGVFIPWGLRP